MSSIQANAAVNGAYAVAMKDVLKAAILTSAAAFMSRTPDDVVANAALTKEHLDRIGEVLDSLRNSVLHQNGVGTIARLKGDLREIDIDAFNRIAELIDHDIESYKHWLDLVLSTIVRENGEKLIASFGIIGRDISSMVDLFIDGTTRMHYTYWED